MSKHNKKEESIFDKMENMTGIPVMYLAIILAVVVVIVIIGILYMVDMLPLDMLNGLSFNVEDALPAAVNITDKNELTPAAVNITDKNELTPPPPSPPQNITMNGGNIKIFKKR